MCMAGFADPLECTGIKMQVPDVHTSSTSAQIQRRLMAIDFPLSMSGGTGAGYFNATRIKKFKCGLYECCF